MNTGAMTHRTPPDRAARSLGAIASRRRNGIRLIWNDALLFPGSAAGRRKNGRPAGAAVFPSDGLPPSLFFPENGIFLPRPNSGGPNPPGAGGDPAVENALLSRRVMGLHPQPDTGISHPAPAPRLHPGFHVSTAHGSGITVGP